MGKKSSGVSRKSLSGRFVQAAKKTIKKAVSVAKTVVRNKHPGVKPPPKRK